MKKTNTPIRFQRNTSVILISDSDDDNNDNTNVQQTQTQYSTPMVQYKSDIQINIQPRTTNQSQLTILPSSSSQRSFKLKENKKQQQEQFTTPSKNVDMMDSTSIMASPFGLSQPKYLPYTINMNNQERLSILPIYPSMNNDIQLLLANVPINHLSQQELTNRQKGKYKASFSIIDSNASTTTSFMVQQYRTYYASLLERLNVDLSILDRNYIQLKKIIELHRQAYIRTIGHDKTAKYQFNLPENEFAQLLEYYLQIDVDLFYMKTCAFRNAQPRSQVEGLFCSTIPDCLYVMARCNKCAFCNSFDADTSREQPQQQQCNIQFNLHRKHRFVNGYESILNCPTSCDTNNIIYVLTCQCGNYDYIGETSDNLRTRLSSHNCFTHRLILEKLIGEKTFIHFYGAKSQQMIDKERMRLYQHPMNCSSTVQSFLNQNSEYWIFVPMLNEEANQENAYFQKQTILPNTTTNNQNKTNLQQILDTLPKPPSGYKFSNYQVRKQYEFFATKLYKKTVNYNFLVYNATTIAVLPLNTSDLFRRILHSLFVTHAETKLNTLGHLFTYYRNVPINQSVWCANLRHRPTTIFNTSAAAATTGASAR
jgi:hypothetical protein